MRPWLARLVQSTFGLVQGNFLCAHHMSPSSSACVVPHLLGIQLSTYVRSIDVGSFTCAAASAVQGTHHRAAFLLVNSSVAGSIVVFHGGIHPTHTQHYSASVPPCYPALSSWGVTVNCTTYPSLLQGYSLIFMGGFAISLRLLLFATITFLIFSLPDTNNTYAVYTYHFTTSSNIIPIQRIGFWEEPLCIHDEHIGFGRSHSTIIRNGHTIYNMGGGFDYFPISWILF